MEEHNVKISSIEYVTYDVLKIQIINYYEKHIQTF